MIDTINKPYEVWTKKPAATNNDCHEVGRNEYYLGEKGRQLYVREISPRHRSSNQWVVFVHGATFPSNVDFDLSVPGYSISEYLALKGVNCCIFDMRGYGKSYKPLYGEPIGLTQKADDLERVCDHLLHHRAASSFIFVGLSSGCNVIMELLKYSPIKPHALIFMGPVYLINRWIQNGVRRARFARFLFSLVGRGKNLYVRFSKKLLQNRLLKGEETCIRRNVFDIFVDMAIGASCPGCKRLRTPVLSFPDVNESRQPWSPLFNPRIINCPLLILRGERDKICCTYTAETLVRDVAAGGSGVQLITFANRSHDMHLYTDHADVFKCIEEFVRQLKGSAA